MKAFIPLICMAIFFPVMTMARPVSYPGGITLMQQNDMETNSLHIHYSPTVKYSFGLKSQRWREEKWRYHGVQFNYLMKRWNKPASQANAYFKSSIGNVETEDGDEDLGSFAGIALDWENRRFFTSYENRIYDPGVADRFFTQKARLGIAPYIGDYGDLHTWLMVQVDHRPEDNDPISVTTLIRLFKSEYLTEIGVSDDGSALVNFVIRF